MNVVNVKKYMHAGQVNAPLVRAALINNPNLTSKAYNKLKEDEDTQIVTLLEEAWTAPPENRGHRS